MESLLRSCDARGTSVRVQGPQFDSSHPKSTLSLLKVASETSRKDLTFSADVKWRWKFGSAPIVILEGLAFLAKLKFLSRDRFLLESRVFHLFDADSACGAFCKGRSSSLRLNRTCRQVCALQLFSRISCCFACTESDSMAPDDASRNFPPLEAVHHRFTI